MATLIAYLEERKDWATTADLKERLPRMATAKQSALLSELAGRESIERKKEGNKYLFRFRFLKVEK